MIVTRFLLCDEAGAVRSVWGSYDMAAQRRRPGWAVMVERVRTWL